MNFFRNRSLKQQSIIVAVIFLTVIVLQLFWLHSRFRNIDSVQYQIDFARTLQLGNQRLSSQIQQTEQDTPLSPEIISLTRQQDLHLQLIETGGRVPGSDVFLPPLQRLPKITYQNLQTLWADQRNQILEFNSQPADFSKKLVLVQAQSMLVSDWYGKLIDDLYDETAKLHSSITTALAIAVTADMILLILILIAFNRSVLSVLKQIEGNTILHTHTKALPGNEIGSLATQVNEVIEQLRDATDFVKGIGEGKLDMDYKAELDINYAPGKNRLADELISMQSKLKAVNIEEQRRKWSNEGLTKFVDILRNANDNVQTLGDKIISSLVNYTESNQGGLYVLNDDDENHKFLELISLFAFDIKKFEKQRIKLGEGILGQTFLEKETTYLTNMPEDYARITSGLGDTAPKSILIVPLKVDKEVYGIVELASFHEFEPHEISFVEKLGETIASTLSSVKVNQKNKRLLEQSQQQTEEMRAQEEEMRQNMEELTATQEGMNRLLKEAQDKETYLNNLMDASPDAIAAIDRDYRVVLRNNNQLFAQFIAQGVPYEKGYYVLGLFKQDEFEYHKSVYDKAFAGETIQVTKEYFGRKYSISYNPLRSSAGEVIGVSIFAHDESELEGLKAQLSGKQKGSSDGTWGLAEEMEKTFRIQLEAVKITQDELAGRLHK
jgi:putative methionine-R-sulfoxide reductase with GAF domain